MSRPDLHRFTAAPAPLLAAAAGVLAEAIAVLAYAVVDAANLRSGRLQLGLAATAFFMLYGLALGWCAWGLAHATRVARGPVLFSELALLGLAWNAAHAGRVLWTVLMVLAAAVVLAGLLHPRSIAALEDTDDPGRTGDEDRSGEG